MTVAAQSHPPPVEGGARTDQVPSLMALSRQSDAVSRAPTRERVSEAIALVRARQAAASQKSVVKVQDISELRTLRSSVATNRQNVLPKPDNTRSPLAPAGQTSGMSEKKSYHQKTSTPTKQDNFLLNVFASRSEVATTHSHHEMDSQLTDAPEENAPTYGTRLAFMNPLELVKREFQLATQSASRSEITTATKSVTFVPVSASSAASRENSVPMDPSLDQSESSDSFDEPVDPNTMRDVARFLDELHRKKEVQSFDQDDSSAESSEVVVDAKTMEQVNMFIHSLSRKEAVDNHDSLGLASSTSSDPIDAVRKALSDDFIYGSSEDYDDVSSDGSTNGSVNPETLAEIGEYIDNISQGPVNAAVEPVKISLQPQDAPTYANPETFQQDGDKPNFKRTAVKETIRVTLESDDMASQSLPKLHHDAPTFANPETFDLEVKDRNTFAVVNEEHTLLQTVSSDSNNIGDIVQQTRVSKPSPIYEQVEAKSLTRGAHKDPPSVLTTRNQDQVDPPAPTGNWNEAVMRMHESQAMAPSYSAESLESSSIVLDQHVHVMEEKKTEEVHDQIREAGFEQNLTPVKEVSSIEAQGSEDNIVCDLVQEGKVENKVPPADSIAGCSASSEMIDDAAGPINHQNSADGSDTDDDDNIHLLGRYDIVDTERSNGSSEQSEDELRSEEYDELVDDAGVPVRVQLSGDESDLHNSKASQLLGRYDIIEAEQSHEADYEQDDEASNSSEASDVVSALPNINMRDLPHSPSMKDDNSIPWELKDIASEETMKAGRKTRVAALIPASRAKARKLTSLLSDDSSVPQSSVVDSDHGSDVDDMANGAPISGLADQDEGKVEKMDIDQDKRMSQDDTESAQAYDGGINKVTPKSDSVFEKDVDPGVHTAEHDMQQSSLTFDDCIIEEGEDGVEVLGSNNQEKSTSGEACDNMDDEIDSENDFVEIPANPSGDEQSRLAIDQCGGILVDTSVAVATKPDPDTSEKGSNVSHSEENGQVPANPSGDKQSRLAIDQWGGIFVDTSVAVATKPDPDTSEKGSNVSHSEENGQESRPFDGVNDDDAIGAFLTRFGDLQSGDDFPHPNIDASRDEDNEANDVVLNQGFLDDYGSHYESLGPVKEIVQAEERQILDDDEDDDTNPHKNPGSSVPRNLFTLAGIAKFFETLDQRHKDAGEPLAQNVKFFQRLVAPIAGGRKPTIIETAQIRQAAQRAQVPIEVVDRFLDYINEDNAPIPTIFSSTSDNAPDDEFFNQMGDIDDVNEDEAIGAFLTRFGELHRGGHFPDANIDAVQNFLPSATGSAEEAVEIDAEYGYVKKSMMPTLQDEDNEANYSVLNQGFLDYHEPRCESFGLQQETIHAEESVTSTLSMNPSEMVATPRQNLTTFSGIVEYFDSLHQRHSDDKQPLTQQVKFFQRLVVPFVAGKRPTIIEAAQIRQAAQRAQVPIEAVDRFLDYITEDKTSIPAILSSNSDHVVDDLFHEMEEIEDVNEDDAIGAFLTRFGELHRGGHFPDANIDAVKSYIQLDSGSGEEAVEIDAEYGYVKKSMMIPTIPDEGRRANSSVPNQEDRLGFLEQYESLGIERDISQVDNGYTVDDGDVNQSENPPAVDPQNLFTLTGITKYFESLDQRQSDANEPLIQNVKFFQRLVAPIVEGRKPTIIETAQIRQAAQRAQVPIEVVDRFLDYVNEDKAPIPAVMSSNSEFLPDEKFEEMEDLNEDEAIGAFLTRFGALHRGGHFPDADVEAVEKYIQPDAGSGEEAVEIDADYGFVKKEMMIQVIDDDDDDMEWWKEGQQKTNDVPPTLPAASFEIEGRANGDDSNGLPKNNDEVAGKKGILVTKEPALTPSPSHLDEPRLARKQREPKLIVNTRYSNFFSNDEEWTQRKRMATFGAGWESHAKWLSPRSAAQLAKPRPIDGVAAAGSIRRFLFSRRIFKNHQPWKRLYKERTQYHPGFLHVDVNSIYDSTIAYISPPTEEEYIAWEHRDVQQRFLQETSYSFSRNWFGDLVRKRGNQKLKMPICKPKSMEMPIESVPQAGEWTKEWFTQWKSPFNRHSRSSLHSRSDEYTDASYSVVRRYDSDKDSTDGDTYTDRDHTDAGSYTDGSSLRRGNDQSSYSCSADSERSYESSNSEDGSASWEEAPECGQIINVRQKIGERVTRVHPDYTSSLRRSRWRKKYFPRGTFPY